MSSPCYLKLPIQGERVKVNGYLIWDSSSGEAMVIDPGGQADMIYHTLDRGRLRLKYIVLTHGHFDHIAAVRSLKHFCPAAVCMCPADREFICDSEKNAANFAGASPVESFDIDISLTDGKKLFLGEKYITVMETPGHTPGQISLFFAGHIFCGDTILRGSTGRMDLYGANYTLARKSIIERIFRFPGSTVLHCGHGEDSSVEYERKNSTILSSL